MLNQGTPVLPTSGAHPSTPGSSGVALSNNLPTTSGLSIASVRDGRFNVPRGSLPVDEQHRLQQFNQMLSGRNLQQPSLSTPRAVSGSDRGHRLVPGGNAMGVSGMNRSTPGFPGMGSSAMPNAGSMLSSGMVGIPKTGNIHSGGGASQGNSMLRPREAVQHMMRMQAAQGNSPGIQAFSNVSSGINNQPSPVQAYPGHLSKQHQMSPQSHVLGKPHPHLQSPIQATGAQQEAFAIRQRQIHQRYLQQQQQPFPASGTMMPHVQKPQGSSVSPPQNSPQIQPPVSSQPLSIPPVSTSPNINAMAQQNPQKSQLPLQGLGRSPQSGTSGVNNQAGKQRQRQLQQQLQQSARQHPHQRQPTQGQQQNKQLKGIGRGNMIHPNITVDQSHLNGLTMASVNHATEKGEPAVPVRPDQQSNAGTTTSTHLQSKPFVPPLSSNHSQQLPKAFPSPSQQQQMQLHLDNSIQDQSSPAAPCNMLSTSSPSITPAVTPNHQHLLLHQKQRNQVQSTAQRVIHHNHLGNSELLKKSLAERMPRLPQSVTNTTQTASMGTTKVMPQVSNDLKNIKSVGSTAVPALEPPSCVASVQSTASKVVNSSNTDSAGNDPGTAPNQGLAQKHVSGGLPSHGIKGVTQRQQSPPSEEKSTKLLEKPTVQNQKHLASEQQQPQSEEAQEVSSSKPPDTKVE